MSCQVWGNPNAPLLLIGMAPGKEELDQDMPFVGGSGTLLWEVARDAGITRADCYIVNVVGEWPAKKDGAPSVEQIARFRPAFERAVAEFTGRFIVPLGGDALRAVTGVSGQRQGIEAWRGYLMSPSECTGAVVPMIENTFYKAGNKKKGIKKGDPRVVRVRSNRPCLVGANIQLVLPCLHPAGVMRSGRKTLPAFNADWQRIGRALRNELWPSIDYKEGRDAYVPIMGGPFVIDLETAPFLRVGMAGRDNTGSAVAWTQLLTSECRDNTLREFAVPGRTLVAHNAQFDLGVLAQHGMGWDGLIFDTMLAAHILQPDLYKGLNEVASLYLDRPRWKHRSEEDEAAYNLEDAKVEFELFEILSEQLREEGMEKLFYGNIMPALRVLTRMTKRGLLVDDVAREAWLGRLVVAQGDLSGRWAAAAGTVDPNSPQKLAKHLYQTWDLPLKRNRKSGAPTVERSALYELIGDLDVDDPRRAALEVLIEYKKNDKLLTTYTKKGLADDGCVHPYYLPASKDTDDEDSGAGIAGTGRIQARDPNIQQLPPDARAIIIPRPGMVLVSFDFKQLELRIAATLSGDEQLKADLEAGIFERVMVRLGCDRTRAKNVVYGTLYGGGPGALQKALRTRGHKATKKECQWLQDQFSAAYPGLWAWGAHIANTAKVTRCLRNPYGRLRYFYDRGKDRSAALNFFPQSTAADVVWSDLHPLDAAITRHGGAILATIHDEALTEVPEEPERRDAAIEACLGVLQKERAELGVSLPVGVRWSATNWRDMEPWQPNS